MSADWNPPAPPSPALCGAGKGALCCKFLLAGRGGFTCGRYGEAHATLVANTMSAGFLPDTDDCQGERAALEARS